MVTKVDFDFIKEVPQGKPVNNLLELSGLSVFEIINYQKVFVVSEETDYYYDSGATSGDVKANGDGYWKITVSSTDAVPISVFTGYTANTNITINNIENDILYLSAVTSGLTGTYVELSVFTGYTANTSVIINETQNDITYISGVTDTKLNTNIFTGYTANTQPILDGALTGLTNIGSGTTIGTLSGRTIVLNTISGISINIFENNGVLVFSADTGGDIATITGATNGLNINSIKQVGLGGTLTGNTIINTNNYSVGFIGNSISGPFGFTGGSFGLNSFAFGLARAEGDYSFASGKRSYAIGLLSHAEGYYNRAIGTYSHAEGYFTCALGFVSHSEGGFTISDNGGHAEGSQTCALGYYSHSQNQRTVAIGWHSHAGGSGYFSFTKQIFACGLASFNHSKNDGSQIHGHGANADYSAILGGVNHNITSGNTRAAIIGGNAIKLTGTTYIDTTAVANLAIFSTPSTFEGDVLTWNPVNKKVTKSSLNSLAGITGATNGLGINSTKQIGLGGILTGNTCVNTNNFGIAFGYNSTASGQNSFAEGRNTIASGYYSHAEGFLSCALGTGSHAENNSYACGLNSHSENFGSALGDGSHAEGSSCACASLSHAEGSGTRALGNYSHTEGTSTYTTAPAAHAEGNTTTAQGNASHSEGKNTCAYGSASHSGGYGVGTTKEVLAFGKASFNHSENTAAQTAGHGALAINSAILGGIDHNIEVGNTGATIIGGNAIKLTGTTYINTTAVANLAIFTTPSTFNGDVLTWNPVNKIVTKLSQNSLLSGYTTLNIFNSYTAETTANINYISGVTDTKLDILTFSGYTGNTTNIDNIIDEGELLGVLGGELTGITISYIESQLPINEIQNDILYLSGITDNKIDKITGVTNQIGFFLSNGNLQTSTGFTFIENLPYDTSVTANTLQINNGMISGISYQVFTQFPEEFDDHIPGLLHYNDTNKTLEFHTFIDEVTYQLGQEFFVVGVNKTGDIIPNGSVVKFAGTVQGNRPVIEIASGNTEENAFLTIGVATHDIPNNEEGYITTQGLVRGIDMSAFSNGDVVYLANTTGLTNTKPSYPNPIVRIGIVTNNDSNQGILEVEVNYFYDPNAYTLFSTFTGYTATTDIRITNIENDIIELGGLKRVEIDVIDNSLVTIDCSGGTDVYVTWSTALSAATAVMTNTTPNSVVDFSILKTYTGETTITLSGDSLSFVDYDDKGTPLVSLPFILPGAANNYYTLSNKITKHIYSGNNVVYVQAK